MPAALLDEDAHRHDGPIDDVLGAAPPHRRVVAGAQVDDEVPVEQGGQHLVEHRPPDSGHRAEVGQDAAGGHAMVRHRLVAAEHPERAVEDEDRLRRPCPRGAGKRAHVEGVVQGAGEAVESRHRRGLPDRGVRGEGVLRHGRWQPEQLACRVRSLRAQPADRVEDAPPRAAERLRPEARHPQRFSTPPGRFPSLGGRRMRTPFMVPSADGRDVP